MGVIRNYGFMWERGEVEWGKRGQRGTLLGIKRTFQKQVIDFRRQLGIYVLYDRFDQPIQIGQTDKLFQRFQQHKRDHLRNRWTRFSWFGFHPVDEKNNCLLTSEQVAQISFQDAKDEIEAVLIQVLEPRLNRAGAKWKDTNEYLQFISEEEAEEEEAVQ
jgi:hypothetical protein